MGVIASDTSGRITLVNKAIETWLGYSSEELLGFDDIPTRLHFPEEIAKARLELSAEFGEELDPNGPIFTYKSLKGMRYDREWTHRRKNGSGMPVHISISAMRGPAGTIVGFVGVITNLTKEKEDRAQMDLYVRELEAARSLAEERNRKLEASAQELKESRDLAIAATRTKSEFLANMSHEIRTPMNGVMGMAHLLQNTSLTDRQRGFVGTILRSADSLLIILNDILDLSKMEAGKMTLEHFPFDLRVTLEEVCESLATSAHSKGIELTFRMAPGVPEYVLGDPIRIRQVLANLVSNAIKFTASGEVRLEVEASSQREASVTYNLSVTDTGIGIPNDRLMHIFESFTQADGSTTREFGGTGLGLAIVKQLVELMGGRIGVRSEVGKGSEFWIELTLPTQEIHPEFARTPRDLHGQRILIVDDNATNREVLRELLGSWNCQVFQTTSGFEAVEFVRRDPHIDAVILDMHMSGLDGMQTAAAIRAIPHAANIPFVLLTSGAFSSVDSMESELFGTMLLKPIRSQPLFDSLAHLTMPAEFRRTESHRVSTQTEYQLGEANALKGKRILVVEDNSVNQLVATEILAAWGCQTASADNGAIAVAMVEHEHFDVILMDVQMPVMDGFAATLEIRNSEAGTLRHIPIIAMTANAMSGDRERCLQVGMDGYVAKPLEPKVLMEQLMEFLGEDKSSVTSEAKVAPSALSVFEVSRLEETCGGKTSLMLRVIDRYIATSIDSVSEIERAAEDKDAVRLAAAAHALKGSSLTIGSPAVGAICQEIEHAAREGRIESNGAASMRGIVLGLHSELSDFVKRNEQPA